jgi:hypothetical protein
MSLAFSHVIGPLVPVLLMLSIVVTNHVVTGSRTNKKTIEESARFSAALAAELRAVLELYGVNLALIERKADYMLSTRSSIVVYKGNLGRLTLLLDKIAIEPVVSVFAQNERIEAIVAAHSNFKCNLTYQFTPADEKFAEWKVMYEQASCRIAEACRILEERSDPAACAPVPAWWPLFAALFGRGRELGERRWAIGYGAVKS